MCKSNHQCTENPALQLMNLSHCQDNRWLLEGGENLASSPNHVFYGRYFHEQKMGGTIFAGFCWFPPPLLTSALLPWCTLFTSFLGHGFGMHRGTCSRKGPVLEVHIDDDSADDLLGASLTSASFPGKPGAWWSPQPINSQMFQLTWHKAQGFKVI